MATNSTVQATLERLAKMTAQNKKSGGSKFYKPKQGKNNLLVLATPMTGDPFLEWGSHKNLLEVSYYDIACNMHNKGEECLICQVVSDLQKQNWKGNFPIWKPIELKIRHFSPVIDLDDVSAGVQWWGYGKSVLSQFEAWLINLEGDEAPFYDKKAPQKVIVTYNKEAIPADMYKLDKKPIKAFTDEQYEEWEAGIKPLVEVFSVGKTQEEISTALQEYITKMQSEIEATTPAEETASSKLDSLKS